MAAPSTSAAPGGLTDALKSALLTLLADEDPAVSRAARARILSEGLEAQTWLRPHLRSNEPVLRRRVAEILDTLERQRADTEFLAFSLRHGEECDLETGAWLLARTQYPDINVAGYQAWLDSIAADIRERLGDTGPSLRSLAVLNDHLFNELGFRGNEREFYDPQNSYLNRVLDRRTGNPISLSILYWLLGRRLRLPVVGVALPRHFVCRFQTSTDTVFIDVFRRGKLLTRADCIRFLQQIGQGFQESYLAPATAGRTLLRLCSNLHQIYHELHRREDEARFQRYVVALARH